MTTFDEKMKKIHRILGGKIGKNYYGNVYIGATKDPEKRKKRYEDMEEFIILYETTNHQKAKEVERHLIDYAKEHYGSKTCNVGKGGERIKEGEKKYYIYVAMGYSCRLKGS